MSSLWTPSGEHPVGRRPAGSEPGEQPAGGAFPPGAADAAGAASSASTTGAQPRGGPESATEASRLEELRRQLADTPAAVVVANHCFGLFELAAVYLSQPDPRVDEAQVAIDAMGAIIDSLPGRLGDAEHSLRDALAQIRLAYVQIGGTTRAAAGEASGDGRS